MQFNDCSKDQDCDNMCLRFKACGGCHHGRARVNGKYQRFPPNNNCEFEIEYRHGHDVQG